MAHKLWVLLPVFFKSSYDKITAFFSDDLLNNVRSVAALDQIRCIRSN